MRGDGDREPERQEAPFGVAGIRHGGEDDARRSGDDREPAPRRPVQGVVAASEHEARGHERAEADEEGEPMRHAIQAGRARHARRRSGREPERGIHGEDASGGERDTEDPQQARSPHGARTVQGVTDGDAGCNEHRPDDDEVHHLDPPEFAIAERAGRMIGEREAVAGQALSEGHEQEQRPGDCAAPQQQRQAARRQGSGVGARPIKDSFHWKSPSSECRRAGTPATRSQLVAVNAAM